MAKIIAIHGLAGHGKDTFALMLVEEIKNLSSNYPTIIKESFALNVKLNVERITGVKLDRLESGAFDNPIVDYGRQKKDLYLEDFKMTLGKFMQLYATEACRDTIHKDIWAISLINRMNVSIPNIDCRIITDLRFDNEIVLLKEKVSDLMLIKIFRPEYEINDSRDKNHESEKGLPDHLFDYIVHNDEDLELLRKMAIYMAKKIAL